MESIKEEENNLDERRDDSAELADAITQSLVTLSNAQDVSDRIKEQMSNGESLWDSLFDNDDLTALGQSWLEVAGYPLSKDDLDLARATGNIIAAVNPAKVVADLTPTLIKAAKGDDVSDDASAAIITALKDAMRRGQIAEDDWKVVTKAAFGYALPLIQDNLDDWVSSLLNSFSSWFVEGGSEGIKMPASLLLSGIYRALPDPGRAAILAALSALVDTKAAFNPITTAVDVATTLINQIARLAGAEPEILPIQAATNVLINGVEWSVFPIGGNYIMIASQNVSGPDVVVYSTGSSPGAKGVASKVFKAASNLLGNVPMGDIVSAASRLSSRPQVLSALVEAANYEDTLKGIAERVLQEAVRYVLQRTVAKADDYVSAQVNEYFSQVMTALRDPYDAARDLYKRLRRSVREGLTTIRSSSNNSDLTNSEVAVKPIGELDSLTQPIASQVLSSNGGADSHLEGKFTGGDYPNDESRVDYWYIGRRPGTQGDKF